MASVSVEKEQVMCVHCEEFVHPDTVRCPYCHYDLSAPFATKSFLENEQKEEEAPSKVTRLSQIKQPHEVLEEAMMQQRKVYAEERPQEKEEKVQVEDNSFVLTTSSLILLLSGSFFLIFSFLLKAFAKNGKLILEWDGASFPYYFIFACLLLGGGFFALNLIEKD